MYDPGNLIVPNLISMIFCIWREGAVYDFIPTNLTTFGKKKI